MKSESKLTFEESYAQLEEVVRQLERGDLPLDQSLALFEKGMRLARLCESKLDEAEQKVSGLVGIGTEAPTPTPFRTEN
jgi:exodeoxyribonuclease VII small subunit